jgi:hypothetical protein
MRSSNSKMLFLLSLALTTVSVRGSTVQFSDDFNRPNGPVGNGWSTWGNPNSSLAGGQLQTMGEPNVAGGIYRTLTVTFPLTFSFDFSTYNPPVNPNPSLPYNDGGWFISFNADSPTYQGPTEVSFYQYAGSRTINRIVGTTSDASPGLPGQIPGWEDYNTSPSLVTGTVNADLSALITITYPDGTSVSTYFGPESGGTPGNIFMIGNSDESPGPDVFGNLIITSPQTVNPVPEPPSIILAGIGLALTTLGVAMRRKRGYTPLTHQL